LVELLITLYQRCCRGAYDSCQNVQACIDDCTVTL